MMFKMDTKPYLIRDGKLWVENAISAISQVTLVAKSGDREYSTEGVDTPGAYCAFYIQGRTSLVFRGNSFQCIAHRTEDGLLIEPVSGHLTHGRFDTLDRKTIYALFGVKSEAAKVGRCATHGVNYSQFTTTDAELMLLTIEQLWLNPRDGVLLFGWHDGRILTSEQKEEA